MKEKGLGKDEINSVMNDMYRSFKPVKGKNKTS